MKKADVRKLFHPCRIARQGARWRITTWIARDAQVVRAIGRAPARKIGQRLEFMATGPRLESAAENAISAIRAHFASERSA